MFDYIQLFKDRHLFNQCTNEEKLNSLLNEKKITFYIGFDATADALHAGSLVQLRAIKTLIKHGHQAIVLLGGGTTKIGDPSGKDASRQILTYETIQKNIENFKRIFEHYFRDFKENIKFINIVATLINFIFLAFVIGPDEIGYNESFGSLLGLVGLAQGLSFLGLIRLSGKLFNAKDNPLLAGAVAVTYGVSIVGLMFSLTPTFIANGFNVRGISADTVTDLSFYLNFTQFLFGALWIANVVRADEGQLPSWGKTVGSIQAYGSAAVLFAFYFGVGRKITC